jgi:hypothetical protein
VQVSAALVALAGSRRWSGAARPRLPASWQLLSAPRAWREVVGPLPGAVRGVGGGGAVGQREAAGANIGGQKK